MIFCFELTAQQLVVNPGISMKINYADLINWAAHPNKKDMADSVPSPLQLSDKLETGVDVFFIHPTTFTNKNDARWNADIEDNLLNKETDKSTILYQASAFNEGNRLFAPRYRQAHIRAFFSEEAAAEQSLEIAYQDVRSAFQYYLEHENHGAPIIIAAHSQGTRHAGRLLKEFFEDKPLQKKLVCAYLIGMPIPETYFSSIPPCADSTQTGCFVGWRTYKKNYVPAFVKKETFKSVVVNPLSWTLDEKFVSAKKNKGGILRKFNKVIHGVVDAQVHGNILWACVPHIFGRIFIRQKNFHIGDINLYYLNIRENVGCRIRSFFKKQAAKS